MSDPPQSADEFPPSSAPDGRSELRTIAFRMRELQRLLGMRVEQENRRLEAEGLQPVTRPRFLEEEDAGER